MYITLVQYIKPVVKKAAGKCFIEMAYDTDQTIDILWDTDTIHYLLLELSRRSSEKRY